MKMEMALESGQSERGSCQSTRQLYVIIPSEQVERWARWAREDSQCIRGRVDGPGEELHCWP